MPNLINLISKDLTPKNQNGNFRIVIKIKIYLHCDIYPMIYLRCQNICCTVLGIDEKINLLKNYRFQKY